MSPAQVDQRSVGELLLDADFHTRQLLIDVTGDDAPAMLRTWGEVVQTASELWSFLPQAPVPSPTDGATMRQLETMSQAQHRTQLTQRWPGEGPSDERLLTIADDLARATDLVHRYGSRVRPTRQDVRDDLAAARMRLMHTLYVGSHAVGVAVYQHVRDLQERTTKHISPQATRGIPRGQEASARLSAFEQLAGAYIGNRFSRVVSGEHTPPPWDASRLHQALTAWDIQAHRTLAVAPTPSNLHLSARTEAAVATAGAAILDAAAHTGWLNPRAHRDRLVPAIDGTQQAWTRLASRWGEMVTRENRTEPDLVQAANEVRAAIYEIAIDKTGWAAPGVIAARIDLGDAAATIQQAMAASVDQACVHRDVAEQDPHLAGPARLMAKRAQQSVDAAEAHGTTTPDVPWVSPADVHANRPVRVPTPVHAQLLREADRLVITTQAAMSAGGELTDVARPQTSPGGEHSPLRHDERRSPAATSVAGNRPGPLR